LDSLTEVSTVALKPGAQLSKLAPRRTPHQQNRADRTTRQGAGRLAFASPWVGSNRIWGGMFKLSRRGAAVGFFKHMMHCMLRPLSKRNVRLTPRTSLKRLGCFALNHAESSLGLTHTESLAVNIIAAVGWPRSPWGRTTNSRWGDSVASLF
jgi:hypothetical protein